MWCFNISTLPLAGARQRKEEKRRNKRPEGKSAAENCVQQCACRFAEWGPESATRSLSFFLMRLPLKARHASAAVLGTHGQETRKNEK